MIVSASRRTDIPTYYASWFLNRVKAGYVYVRNPMNARQIRRISLSPDVVDGIVFWTKNPLPMLDRLDALKDYRYYFQFTLNSYGADVERNIPSKGSVIVPAFQRLSDLIGPDRVSREAIVFRWALCYDGLGGKEEYDYPPQAWDCVVSNLALHYLADLDAVFQNVYRTLAPGGAFVMNIEHPVFTAGVGQDWVYGADGAPLYWPVDDYFRPGARTTQFLGCTVVKQHHTLTQIVQGLLRQGFALQALEEAQPPAEMLALPGMRDELRRPMMLLLRADK